MRFREIVGMTIIGKHTSRSVSAPLNLGGIAGVPSGRLPRDEDSALAVPVRLAV